jgi:DNA-binding IclR family transcriptional regulator
MPMKRWDGIRSAAALERACEKVRARGQASAQNEDEETFSIACPVRDGEGRLIGALGCFAPQFRTLKRDEERIRRELRATAARLGRQIHTGGA